MSNNVSRKVIEERSTFDYLDAYVTRKGAKLFLSASLALLVSFYVWFTQKKIGVTLPEDNLNAEIADGAGELGFYSPHSWWPLPVAAFAVLAGLGLIIGWWLTAIAIGLLVVSIIGFVTEYEQPETAAHH